MLSVRQLKELTRSLDAAALEKQLGAFVLIQRPLISDAKRVETLATRPLANPNKPGTSRGVFDFEDLWVATLPPIRSRDSFVLGRSPDCELVIDADTVSKQHARIDWSRGVAHLSDLQSSNGVFVNRVKLGNDLRALEDNDLITLGSVEMFFMMVTTLRRRMGINASNR